MAYQTAGCMRNATISEPTQWAVQRSARPHPSRSPSGTQRPILAYPGDRATLQCPPVIKRNHWGIVAMIQYSSHISVTKRQTHKSAFIKGKPYYTNDDVCPFLTARASVPGQRASSS
ncbi:hypothetical protein BaRGS_00032480, partial [Batillaria attramentaria]